PSKSKYVIRREDRPNACRPRSTCCSSAIPLIDVATRMTTSQASHHPSPLVVRLNARQTIDWTTSGSQPFEAAHDFRIFLSPGLQESSEERGDYEEVGKNVDAGAEGADDGESQEGAGADDGELQHQGTNPKDANNVEEQPRRNKLPDAARTSLLESEKMEEADEVEHAIERAEAADNETEADDPPDMMIGHEEEQAQVEGETKTRGIDGGVGEEAVEPSATGIPKKAFVSYPGRREQAKQGTTGDGDVAFLPCTSAVKGKNSRWTSDAGRGHGSAEEAEEEDMDSPSGQQDLSANATANTSGNVDKYDDANGSCSLSFPKYLKLQNQNSQLSTLCETHAEGEADCEGTVLGQGKNTPTLRCRWKDGACFHPQADSFQCRWRGEDTCVSATAGNPLEQRCTWLKSSPKQGRCMLEEFAVFERAKKICSELASGSECKAVPECEWKRGTRRWTAGGRGQTSSSSVAELEGHDHDLHARSFVETLGAIDLDADLNAPP
ncbi:unnamed protein product, partial [Amoebophrya sp. A25]